ncbi:MAG: VOC family protein [Syntrophomonadaceae bacterium]|jgi:methylmalonyl-CoA/ethylmalonyl-CoA epimerase
MADLKEIFNQIDQVSIVVKDIEKVRAGMKRVFGLDPSSDQVNHYKNIIYHSKPTNCDVHMLVYDWANIKIEFLSPLGGESVWQDFTDNYGEGIQSIRFNIDNYEAAQKAIAEKGIDICQSGESVRGGGLKFDFYNTIPFLGFTLEAINLGEVEKKDQK